MRRSPLVPALALAATLALAAPAGALPPTTVHEASVDFTDVNTDLCGFEVTFVENGSYKIKTFYDREGNATRTILTNSNDRYRATASANGRTLSANYPLAIMTDLENGTRTEVGLRNAYTVPGAGVVLLDAGRLVIDDATREVVLFEAGSHDFFEGDAEAFCGYFAAP